MDVGATKKNVLFITYDGLTDPLGQSQILPYILGIAAAGYTFTVLSFEKKERFTKYRQVIDSICQHHQIQWEPQTFHTGIPFLSKAYDRWLMKKKALNLHRKLHLDAVHCRSYIAAECGLLLKKKFGTPFIFDMRGFWADEKKDGGSWPQNQWVYRKIYQFYKQQEKEYLLHANGIVALTYAAEKEMLQWSFFPKETPRRIIPCSVDCLVFPCRQVGDKELAKKNLQLPETAFVVSYLGALGSWYMVDAMLDFFAAIKRRKPEARFLILTHSPAELIWSQLASRQLNKKDFILQEASRTQLTSLLYASDVSLCFIKPVYSKISSSPTKLGELFSMGIPVVANQGVGDVAEIVKEIQGGVLFDADQVNYDALSAELLEKLPTFDEHAISENTRRRLDLKEAVKQYITLYKELGI